MTLDGLIHWIWPIKSWVGKRVNPILLWEGCIYPTHKNSNTLNVHDSFLSSNIMVESLRSINFKRDFQTWFLIIGVTPGLAMKKGMRGGCTLLKMMLWLHMFFNHHESMDTAFWVLYPCSTCTGHKTCQQPSLFFF